ncbi:MAG: endonuclease/exonuclease/phosphatase family metal-dependent hydrolase [Ilumatobacter sp.]|jgi:endonuclease/exonuclease/phosphatase family metal-dependent hydrolase
MTQSSLFHKRSFAQNGRATPTELLVVSWNIQFGVKAQVAADALMNSAPLQGADFILLQEMDEQGTALIAETLGLDYVYAAASVHPRTGRNFGNAVLSRWPLTDAAVVALPYRSALQGQPRQVVHAVANLGDLRLRACSVHTEVVTLSSPKRLKQYAAIQGVADAWETNALIIGGDFNTLTRRGVAAVSARLAQIGAHRVTHDAGPTLRRGGRKFFLDHIYARALTPHSCGVVTGLDTSDHDPLWVRLTCDNQADHLHRT